MQRCLYILPTTLDHEGITHKFNGQCKALSQRFKLRTCYMRHARSAFFISKLCSYLYFEWRAFWGLLTTQICYVRYNPKTPFLLFWILPFSYLKPIYIEHNTIMDTELEFLGRKSELLFHKLTCRWLGFSRCMHIAVNKELQRHLEHKGLSRVIYAQNGYLAPEANTHQLSNEILARLNAFQANHEKTAIFCGNGYPWHGYSRIVECLNPHPNIGLIVVGPYKNVDTDHVLHLEFCNTSTLAYLLGRCDFAISTFQWEMLKIHEGSPLKSRQYLCHGCPILVNYYDCASDFKALRPFIVDYRKDPSTSINRICSISTPKDEIQALARDCLSWDRYFDEIFQLTT